MPIQIAQMRALLRGRLVVGPLGDGSYPLYGSAEEGNVTNATVAVLFNEAITSAGDNYVNGVTIKVNGVEATISSGTLQGDGVTVYYVLDTAADANDTITWEYSDTLGDIADTAFNQLGDVTAQDVANNIGTHLWFDNDADSGHAFLGFTL